jgi:PRC-barrel domain protein
MDQLPQMCYLRASQVQGPVGDLADVRLRTADDSALGKLDGVLINPAERRVVYFVVRSSSWRGARRFLVPSDVLLHMEADRTLTVHVGRDELSRCEEFDKRKVRDFSDDDVVTAMFARPAA